MKRLVILTVILFMGLLPAGAREYVVSGPEGGLAMKVALPEGFNPETDRCPMVLLMHGIFSSKDYNPMPSLAKALAKAGIASIRFDFDGHGKSEGRMQDMTIEKEIADAMAIWEYARSLPYVTQIGLLGHSQGGVIASMTAGRLAAAGRHVPAGVVLLAPGSVIKQACQGGKFFNARFDPADPPAFIRCWGTSSWTSTAPPPPTTAPSCSSMAPKTPSSPCGAASSTSKPTATAPPWSKSTAKTTSSPAAKRKSSPAPSPSSSRSSIDPALVLTSSQF